MLSTGNISFPSLLLGGVSPLLILSSYHSNLSIHAEALLTCLDAGLAAIEPIQLEAVTALRAAVASRWTDAVVDVYGSNYTRLALPMSDIDCVLMSKSLSGESPFKILKELEELVQAQPWAKRVDFLGSAKIPVLKIAFLSVTSNLEVLLDLTCGHSPGHSGLSARDLIYSCQAEMPALRPLVMILKCHLHSYGKFELLWRFDLMMPLTSLSSPSRSELCIHGRAVFLCACDPGDPISAGMMK